jgi:hypothetical protein
MGIQKDSAEVLAFLYNKHVSSERIFGLDKENLSEELKWESSRVGRTLAYLGDKGLIEIIESLVIERITAKGVDTIENESKFKLEFGINLGILNIKIKED